MRIDPLRSFRWNVVSAILAAAALLLAGCDFGESAPPSADRHAIQPGDDDGDPGVADPGAAHPAGGNDGPTAASQPAAPPVPFHEWPKPALALVLTGQQLGYIEPCGCTGLENQKGGLARRHTLIKQLADERGWTVVPLDVGSQVRRFGKQSEIKFQHTSDALRLMGYRAITLGADDLRLPAGELLSGTNPPDQPGLFVSANVALLARELQPTFVIVEAGGKKIGVTAVLGDKAQSQLKSDELVHEPALAALKATCRTLKDTECDLYVLLAHTTPDEARTLAEEVPIFDLVVVAGQTNAPSSELQSIPGLKTKMVQTGIKAMFAGVVGVFDDQGQPLRYESVPLDKKLPDSPEMLKMLAAYQQRLEDMGLDELGLAPREHPSGRKFVGSEKCGECHTKAFAIWSKTPHSHATDSLVHPPNSRDDIARHFDPECLSCHVTGWEPQKFHPFESGYLSLDKTPLLKHNGCENCHGPGSEHVALEEAGVASPEVARRRNEMKLLLAGGVAERKCVECHDDDNSPDFHAEGAFEKYWKKVEHRGKD